MRTLRVRSTLMTMYVFIEIGSQYFASIPDETKDIGFLNLGTSPFFNLKPQLGQLYQLPNNGGCECTWWSLDA
jgi:hypothetical protein